MKDVEDSVPFTSHSPYHPMLAYRRSRRSRSGSWTGLWSQRKKKKWWWHTSALNSVNSNPRQSISIIFWVLRWSLTWYVFGPEIIEAVCVFYINQSAFLSSKCHRESWREQPDKACTSTQNSPRPDSRGFHAVPVWVSIALIMDTSIMLVSMLMLRRARTNRVKLI